MISTQPSPVPFSWKAKKPTLRLVKTNRQPKTIDAAVDAVLRELTTGKREELATLAEDELDGLFYTLGATIRNYLALSTGNKQRRSRE